MSDYRHEVKFSCGEHEIDRIYQWLGVSDLFFSKQFPDRFINNIYFDTFDFKDASDNLAGISRREKLRLRWYGDCDAEADMQLEQKLRLDRLGKKNIIAIGEFSLRGVSKVRLAQVLSAAIGDDPLQYDLRLRNPVVRNRYRRQYFIDNTGQIRVTVDRQQSFYSVDRHHDVLVGNRVDYPVCVVEVKYLAREDKLAGLAMRGLPLRPSRHSKYLAGLARMIEEPYFI